MPRFYLPHRSARQRGEDVSRRNLSNLNAQHIAALDRDTKRRTALAAELTRLRAQVAAADKLAADCVRSSQYEPAYVCHNCGMRAKWHEPREAIPHKPDCPVRAYLSTKAPAP